jgi:hypothetical protein
MTKQKKSKGERLEIVLSIIRKLQNFPKQGIDANSPFINLYNIEYIAIQELKNVFEQYLNQEDNISIGVSGSIRFPEINRTIQYNLPVGKKAQPLFVLKHRI